MSAVILHPVTFDLLSGDAGSVICENIAYIAITLYNPGSSTAYNVRGALRRFVVCSFMTRLTTSYCDRLACLDRDK